MHEFDDRIAEVLHEIDEDSCGNLIETTEPYGQPEMNAKKGNLDKMVKSYNQKY